MLYKFMEDGKIEVKRRVHNGLHADWRKTFLRGELT